MMKQKKPPTTTGPSKKKYTNLHMLLSMIMTVLITRTFDQTNQIQGLTSQNKCTCDCVDYQQQQTPVAVSEQIVSIPPG